MHVQVLMDVKPNQYICYGVIVYLNHFVDVWNDECLVSVNIKYILLMLRALSQLLNGGIAYIDISYHKFGIWTIDDSCCH